MSEGLQISGWGDSKQVGINTNVVVKHDGTRCSAIFRGTALSGRRSVLEVKYKLRQHFLFQSQLLSVAFQ
jgi:hypothetical protein